MMKYDIVKYATHAAAGYATILAYDTLVLGFKLDGGFAMSDASSYAISTVLTNFSGDFLISMVPFLNDNNYLGSIVGYPLIQGVIYMYVFDMMTNKKYPGFRDSTNAFLIGSVGLFITKYIESPLLSLFGLNIL